MDMIKDYSLTIEITATDNNTGEELLCGKADIISGNTLHAIFNDVDKRLEKMGIFAAKLD